MDNDDRELITHLFAKATALLEDATQLAAEGQSSQLTSRDYLILGDKIVDAIAKAQAMAKALSVITEPGP